MVKLSSTVTRDSAMAATSPPATAIIAAVPMGIAGPNCKRATVSIMEATNQKARRPCRDFPPHSLKLPNRSPHQRGRRVSHTQNQDRCTRHVRLHRPNQDRPCGSVPCSGIDPLPFMGMSDLSEHFHQEVILGSFRRAILQDQKWSVESRGSRDTTPLSPEETGSSNKPQHPKRCETASCEGWWA